MNKTKIKKISTRQLSDLIVQKFLKKFIKLNSLLGSIKPSLRKFFLIILEEEDWLAASTNTILYIFYLDYTICREIKAKIVIPPYTHIRLPLHTIRASESRIFLISTLQF